MIEFEKGHPNRRGGTRFIWITDVKPDEAAAPEIADAAIKASRWRFALDALCCPRYPPGRVRRVGLALTVDELGLGTWQEVVDAVTARHPRVTSGKMFGMPCLRRADGKVVAALWKDGGLTVKLVDETARAEALALPGANVGRHAFDPRRKMRAWVHVPAAQAGEWERLVERALATLG